MFRIIWKVIIYTTLATGNISVVDAQSNDSYAPQLNFFQRKGLNINSNPIDRLINLFGYVCVKDSSFSRACTIQIKLVDWLKTLSKNQNDIARELATLGAHCATKNERLDCTYERLVENSYWLAGAPEPETMIDNYFRIDFSVVRVGEELRYEAVFDRQERVKWRRGWPKGT